MSSPSAWRSLWRRAVSEAVAAHLELIGTPPTVVAEMKAGQYWAHVERFAPTLSHEIR
jgi:hypothetical protein